MTAVTITTGPNLPRLIAERARLIGRAMALKIHGRAAHAARAWAAAERRGRAILRRLAAST